MGEVEGLNELAEKINAEHRAFRQAFKATYRSALRAGQLLATQGRSPTGPGLHLYTDTQDVVLASYAYRAELGLRGPSGA